ncbi:restriction endonuclease [Paraliobacillus sediminis]|uniref:restriction endonuclease n=1 Tax=Paraliobacillus sediminis TaxID=1885916 RepID=UPI0013C2A50D|nr:restriction endonuclease [Paraliobacillus sediminis]
MKMFKYYIKQFWKVKTIRHWDFHDKVKFFSITNVLMLTLAISFNKSNVLNIFLTVFFLTSISYFIYLIGKQLLLRIGDFSSKPAYFKNKKFLINEMNQMSSNEFEELLSHLFKQQGYQVKRIPKSEEIGADLLLKKEHDVIVVQAKRRSIAIGDVAVNELLLAAENYNANKKWIITNRYYTSNAILQAHLKSVTLLNRDDLLQMLKAYKTPKRKRKQKFAKEN